jgi:hypothetical protein
MNQPQVSPAALRVLKYVKKNNCRIRKKGRRSIIGPTMGQEQ